MSAGDIDLTPENVHRWLLDFRASINSSYSPFKPQTLEEYVGQEKAKRIVSIIVQAAIKDRRPLPNTMITGPYGQGKTSLARIMADSFDKKIQLIDASSVNKNPLDNGTYIIDEIHNLESSVCDSFNILLDNNDLHIIGCSTDPGQLPAAFRSRFRQIFLENYTESNISTIIRNVLTKKGLSIEGRALKDIAKRSRMNPRVSLNYLAFILDILTLKNQQYITYQIVLDAFKELSVDKEGYSARDYAYLKALPADGRPVGLQYLSAITAIDEKTILSEVEPYLLQQGLIDRTSKGRKLIHMAGK